MEREFIYYAVGISVTMVVAGRYLANAIFPWVDKIFLPKKQRDEKLDELIQARLNQMGHRPVTFAPKQLAENAAPPVELNPEEMKRREQLQRIYAFDGKRLSKESTEDHALRLLGLKNPTTAENLRAAFKTQAKLYHPDTFQLDGFESKLKKRLDARVHENYIAIQKAHVLLRSKIKN